jgi:hypothetical protein
VSFFIIWLYFFNEIYPDLSQLVRYFLKSELQSYKTVFNAPREGRAKRRAAQAVRAKQLELCRADM